MDAPLLTDDFKEFLRLLNANRVDYLLVGAQQARGRTSQGPGRPRQSAVATFLIAASTYLIALGVIHPLAPKLKPARD